MDSDRNSIEQFEVMGQEIKKKKPKKIKSSSSLIGCFKSDLGHSAVEESDVHGNFDIKSAVKDLILDSSPTHLVVTVNGIIGCADDWRFAAKQLLSRYPRDVIVHCSECNYSMLTFDGIDVMGSRLADEVVSVVKRHPDLQKISIIGHSLGGLIARYAIAKLYSEDFRKPISQDDGQPDGFEQPVREKKTEGKIAGLEPVNFISSATPHLGLRGHKQVPLFCGIQYLEKLALYISWLLGRTGKHQFLTDTDDGKPPLLLQMTQDCEDLKFISALQSFKRCVAYSNACYDYVVGWRTSSIRRPNELPKHLSANNRYPHIVNEETAKLDGSNVEPQVNGAITDDIELEEAMIDGLNKVSWERVDVSFSGSKQRFFAHSTIQVKTPSIHSDGADVIQHMVDKFVL
ncbi:DUF676 domain-containing protein [Heracleum sosnowskyi]|uniref:DUF676 domain-containing protein n=1 Tax=Heracleum sosnowskyi TaxID=360622 RepID=A0AAD8N4T0_9APIA|nr:DUF676 domain-containing protein [Heracleum sosnowskyi]